MTLEGFHCKKPYEILSPQEIEKIHSGSLEILLETGMTVADQRSRQILEAGGCQVDHETERVKFPADLVQWAIDQCPDTFTLRARNPELSLDLGGGAVTAPYAEEIEVDGYGQNAELGVRMTKVLLGMDQNPLTIPTGEKLR